MLVTPAAQVTNYQPLECFLHRWPQGLDGPTHTEMKDAMKIYFLVLLIGAIAAASHIKDQRKSPEQAA